jgi:hypothetical protein
VGSYVEHPPLPVLATMVRTVWIQRTGHTAYVQRHLPTGGVEIHFPIGGRPQLVGPLTGPEVEVLPPHTTIVGVRFHPGTPPPLPAVPCGTTTIATTTPRTAPRFSTVTRNTTSYPTSRT